MLFPDVSPSREHVFAALSGALSEKETRIYLDASLLIHTYEISLGARDDLLDALETFSERLAIPLWAANETWEHMRSKITRFPLQKAVTQLNNALDTFRTSALRYVDDDTIPDLDKSQYQSQLDTAMKGVRDLANPLTNHEPKADLTTARLMPFIERHRLDSDLPRILDDVSRKAPARLMHSVPPGFGDAVPLEPAEEDSASKNKGKQKNSYGDIIFWFEALEDCAAKQAEHLVIVTRDTKKRDWVYRPQKVLDERGRPQLNDGVVTLPLPLLVHEAVGRCPKLKGVHIVSLEMFAEVLQRILRIQIPNLAAAIQANDREAKRTTRTPSETAQSGQEFAQTTPTAEIPPTFDSTDMTYDFARGDQIDGLLRSLGVEGWRQQNQAAREIEPLLVQASRDQLVQIGRGFAAAANDGALEPVVFFRRLFSESAFTVSMRANILVGALAQIYIAESGDPKKPQASQALIDFIYEHETDQELQPAYAAVLGRLVAQRKTYLALPTDHVSPLALEVTLEGPRLRAVKAFGNDLLEANVPLARALRRTGQETTMTAAELIAEISREFVVSASILSPDLSASSPVVLSERTGYVTWGPNTGRMLR
jgi:hypothetical protein